jgi:hypothetical protein
MLTRGRRKWDADNHPQKREEKWMSFTQGMDEQGMKTNRNSGKSVHARQRSGRSSANAGRKHSTTRKVNHSALGCLSRQKSEEEGTMSIHKCGKRRIHYGQGMGARRKGEEQGRRPSAAAGRKVHVVQGDDGNHRRGDMGEVISQRLARASKSWKSQDASSGRRGEQGDASSRAENSANSVGAAQDSILRRQRRSFNTLRIGGVSKAVRPAGRRSQ